MYDTYKIILDSYAKRLITTNSRTRTIYYSKNNKYITDISRFINLLDKEEVKKFFLCENDLGVLKFEYGSMSTSRANKLFDKFLNNELNEKQLLENFPLMNESDIEKLKKEKTDCYLELYNKYELMKKKELRKILEIKENNDNIITQMGKDDLYIGYPYIQGKFNKDKVVRAPLLLHKIRIEKEGENIIVSNVGIKMLNPVFVMSYLVENDITYTDSLDFEIIEDDYMPVVHEIFENIGIKYTNKLSKESLSKMKEMTKKEFKSSYKYVDNNFEIVNHMTLGIFPISDKKIYDDVMDLKNSESINQMLNSFYDRGSEAKVFEDQIDDVDENKLKYITVLDYSQKKTLQDALEKNCIIQGPPGTGKSQVICNIAANLLLNRKSTLFCSEKRTATDVIYNRLGKLNSFALLLHDHVSEKNNFYDSIVRAINTARENIDKYRKKTFSFNQDYKINAFFDNAKKYNEIVNGEYKGLTFKDVLLNSSKEVLYEDYFKGLSILINNINELQENIYKYESSDSYGIALKWKNELNKDFYSKYNINISNSKVFKLNNILVKIDGLKNNYLKNIIVKEFIKQEKIKKNIFKKIFNRNEKLLECSLDFIDDSKHDFTVFKLNPFSNNIEELLFNLKFACNLSNDEIVNNYIIYISKEMYKQIDFSFANHFTSTYDQLMKEVFENMDSKMEDSIEFIARSCSADIKEKLSNPEYNDKVQKLLGEVNKKRKPPVKVIMDKYFDILQIIFPIWIMTPDVVSAVIPLKENIFDKVIFDEASQLFIEKAIPAISRSKSVVICGDSKQLRPTLFFESRYDETEEDVIKEVEQESALTENSLLDYATTSNKYTSSMLRYHYRCHYKELINFSNYAFYNGELVFASNIKGKETLPLETINVDGSWDGEKNIVEAKQVVKLVKDLLLTRKDNETVGIVTLNVNQRDLILDLFSEESKKDKEFALLYRKERERKDENTGEDESLFVKNLESVQGDERDIIIFSISYTKNEKGKIGSALGEIQRQYGENRLNVAISRAKKKIYVIKSFMGQELSINEDNKGPHFFKKYLCYADSLNSGDIEYSNNLLFSLVNEDKMPKNSDDSIWLEDDIYNELINKIDSNLFEIRKSIEIGSFIINLAIYEKATNRCLLNIECAGVSDYSSASEVSDSIYKQYYLKVRGYNIYQVWVTDWFNDKENQINKIMNRLNTY